MGLLFAYRNNINIQIFLLIVIDTNPRTNCRSQTYVCRSFPHATVTVYVHSPCI